MNKEHVLKIFNIEDLTELPEAIMNVLFSTDRDDIFKDLIKINQGDMSHDWFQDIYEGELAERKKKKQDFTPNTISLICSKLTDQTGSIHEPTAGNGSMIIADWWDRSSKKLPWGVFPSKNIVDCWELSNRSLPILLINLSIRGIMGYVHHGDVLENNCKQLYILLNEHDDSLSFSKIIKANNNDKIVAHNDNRKYI